MPDMKSTIETMLAENPEIKALVDVLTETVLECGEGPESSFYLPFAERGLTLDSWNQLKFLAIATGQIKQGPGPTLCPSS